ncbi:Adenylate cyclase 2 [Rubripirellula tenax]|uniref:Adenylate cyclase 2 n=2 Tax=Rubripirellula tenax TaxID=2528015 RepID=A0A5C6E7J9_9BACT|nr:Adenylate cyclase 2 [Rubripirellula tenax]
MNGQDVEVSVLFCDIRGFSSVTERLGPQKAIAWINDVMSELSQCVINSDGVLVDYVGDELLAMWGAPGEQRDHATRAVATVQEMLSAIEVLRKRWEGVLPDRFGAGIGVNTGMARVGNVGSRQKFKYGPLGNAINVGSRLQSATKQFGVNCLISGASATAADCLLTSRRLAKLTVVGIAEPVDVYQVVVNPGKAWNDLAKGYEEALAEFENARFVNAAQQLGNLMSMFPGDRPCRMLLSRTLDAMDNPDDNFTSVLKLSNK